MITGEGTLTGNSRQTGIAAALIRLSLSYIILPSLVNKNRRNTTLEAEAHPWPEGGKPCFSGQEPWARIWRCWFSSQLLHTRLQTAPAHEVSPPKEATRYHLQKQRWNPVAPRPIQALVARREFLHKNNEQNLSQRAALPVQHREQVWLTVGNANQPMPVVQWPLALLTYLFSLFDFLWKVLDKLHFNDAVMYEYKT